MVPFFVLVINSFKTTNEFITAPFSLPKEFNIENFKTVIYIIIPLTFPILQAFPPVH